MPTQRKKKEPFCKRLSFFLFFCAFLISWPAVSPAEEKNPTERRQAWTSDALFPLPASLATDIAEEDLLSALKALEAEEVECALNSDCKDNNLCDGEEICSGGKCVEGPLLDCDDRNSCTTDSCNPLTGC